jgi:hypothetical protein
MKRLLTLLCFFGLAIATDYPTDAQFAAGQKPAAAVWQSWLGHGAGDFMPISENSRNLSNGNESLGSSVYKWKNLFLSGTILATTGNFTGTITTSKNIFSAGQYFFGDATNNYVVTSGTQVTLDGECWYNNLTIENNSTVNLSTMANGGYGYLIIRANNIILSGNINGSGCGQGGSNGGASIGGGVAGNPGAALVYYGLGSIGGTGGSGGDRGGFGSGAGGAITYHRDLNTSGTVAGGAGTGTGSNVPGNPGSVGVTTNKYIDLRQIFNDYPLYGTGGSGGGSGTGVGGSTGEAGGMGGTGGPFIAIISTTFFGGVSSNIIAAGTNGAAGTNNSGSGDGGGGGGGGGAGGNVLLAYRSFSGTAATISVAKGLGGAGGGGASGQVGAAGGSGISGNITVINL